MWEKALLAVLVALAALYLLRRFMCKGRCGCGCARSKSGER
jgi:hypothetical protein